MENSAVTMPFTTKTPEIQALPDRSQALETLLEGQNEGRALYADSTSTGETKEETVTDKKMANLVCKKGCKNRPLTELEKEYNREKSRVRSRVEHIFGRAGGPLQGKLDEGDVSLQYWKKAHRRNSRIDEFDI